MAENNAAQTNNAATEAPAQPNKMARCRAIFNVVSADGYTAPEGSSPRKEFIKQSMATVGISNACAVTYYNNLQREKKGGKLYAAPKKAATVAQVQGAEADLAGKSTEQAEGDAQADAALTEQNSDVPPAAEEQAEE